MDELEVAKKAALQAGKILSNYYFANKTGNISAKGSIDKVTEADIESELAIQKILINNFPNYGFYGEELGEIDSDQEYCWYVDPLCGTFNFIHNLPEFGISIGLSHMKKVKLGVVYVPALNELFWAEKSKGAFLNNKKLHVSSTSKLSNSMLSSDFGANSEERLKEFKYIGKAISKCEYLRIGGSFPYQLTRLAMGKLDGHFEVRVPPMHRAASMIIVTEAGGKVTTFNGKPSTIDDNDIVSSNGIIHNELIELLQK